MSEIEIMSALLRDVNSINWDPGTGKIVFNKTNQTVLLQIGSNTLKYEITGKDTEGNLLLTEIGSQRRYVAHGKTGMMIFERTGVRNHTGWAFRLKI